MVGCATGSETTLEELEALLAEGRGLGGGEASGEDEEAMQGWVPRGLPLWFGDGLALLTPRRPNHHTTTSPLNRLTALLARSKQIDALFDPLLDRIVAGDDVPDSVARQAVREYLSGLGASEAEMQAAVAVAAPAAAAGPDPPIPHFSLLPSSAGCVPCCLYTMKTRASSFLLLPLARSR